MLSEKSGNNILGNDQLVEFQNIENHVFSEDQNILQLSQEIKTSQAGDV